MVPGQRRSRKALARRMPSVSLPATTGSTNERERQVLMPIVRKIALFASAAALLGTPALAQAPDGLPDYYPQDYEQIVEGSRGEGGLVIYSNMAECNWAPVIEGFN